MHSHTVYIQVLWDNIDCAIEPSYRPTIESELGEDVAVAQREKKCIALHSVLQSNKRRCPSLKFSSSTQSPATRAAVIHFNSVFSSIDA